MPIVNVESNINVMKGAVGPSFFTSANFNLRIKDLTKVSIKYLYAQAQRSQLGLMALEKLDYRLVVIARLRKTRKLDIKNIKKTKPIDLLFYE